MKKSVLAATLAGVMLLSGCSEVSQDEYNSLLEENSRLKTNITLLENDIHSLQLENATLSQEKESLRIDNIVLQDKLNSQSDSTSDMSISEKLETMLYEDEFVKVSYVGFGKGASFPYEQRECLIFLIENKTETTFEFSPSSISLDGVDTGRLVCYNKLAPQSMGKIYLLKMNDTDQYFENKTPTKITCEMSIKDYGEKGVFGEDTERHSISFINVDI